MVDTSTCAPPQARHRDLAAVLARAITMIMVDALHAAEPIAEAMLRDEIAARIQRARAELYPPDP